MTLTKEKRLEFTAQAQTIVDCMSLEEKVYLMSGSMTPQETYDSLILRGEHYNHFPGPAGGNERLGVAPMNFCDGPRGVVCDVGKSTCFPVPMCRGAGFDTELEEEIGRAIGKEIRGFGGNLFGGVCINLPYNPGWGRSQEVYGEESFLLGQMGAALVRGVQDEQVMACVKHFAFNSMEISRFKVSVDCDRRTEREVNLPHFKECVDAGAACVMSAYNLYKGSYCGHSDYLLRKILKEEWDFDGFVISDFNWGIKDTVYAANGGLDIEMFRTQYFGAKLVDAVNSGLVPIARIDEAALRIVRTIMSFENAYKESGKNYGTEQIGCKPHIDLALRSAQEGITLLQNRNAVLPFDKAGIKKIAVIGHLADREISGDHGSSRVYPAYTVTPLAGITRAMAGAQVLYSSGDDLDEACRIAREADAVVFVLGNNFNDEGEYVSDEKVNHNKKEVFAEGFSKDNAADQDKGKGARSAVGVGGDRRVGLGLHQDEIELIRTIGPENPNTAVVLIGGSMIMMTEWMDCVSSIIMAYYPGQEGGAAIAQILFGDINPSGKLPYVIPRQEGDLPQVTWDTTSQFYQYYHGYAKLEKEGIVPLLPFGFGLSYTSFSVSDPSFGVEDTLVNAACRVTNTGKRRGTEVIQLYVGFKNSAMDRPVKLLRGFKRVALEPGESKQVNISCSTEKLKYYNPATSSFELEKMEYEIYIGTSSLDKDLLSGKIIILS
ncbi:MAG: glycoside hydrolase family 3 C-terminal domain-containing protein [Treponema sp.]|jgi:beta-glucosidase|nr:glycoside hydrolase family 3 C-terminal domain-containing protein [Treponema sp.]